MQYSDSFLVYGNYYRRRNQIEDRGRKRPLCGDPQSDGRKDANKVLAKSFGSVADPTLLFAQTDFC